MSKTRTKQNTPELSTNNKLEKGREHGHCFFKAVTVMTGTSESEREQALQCSDLQKVMFTSQ